MSGIVPELGEVTSTARTELVDPLGRSTVGAEREVRSPILVATDGSRASGAALRIAAALAARQGRRIEAVVVEETFPITRDGVSIGAETLRQERLPDATQLGRVRRQLCAILEADTWNLHVEFGRVGPTIAELARVHRSPLIVMGLSRHHPARRLLGSETAVRVLRSAKVPVLAVASTARELPHVAVIAVDFSMASVVAAKAARDLLARPATLHLIHVRPTLRTAVADIEGWDEIYDAGVTAKLDKLARDVSGNGVIAYGRIVSGKIAESLLRIAGDVRAGLIACGTDSLNTLERLILGRIPAQLLRGAECSVLVAPCARTLETQEESR
jgi:nucleotide-binding universal stress UspA family protein